MNSKPTFLYGLGYKSEYKSLFKYFNVPKINWNNGKITPPIGKVKILVGFSMGAILACEHAINNKVSKLVLCSMTTGVETLEKVKADEVIFIVGEKEKWVIKDTKRVAKTLRCKWKLITVPNGDHEMDNSYRDTILGSVK